jgi:flavin-dependent dehydrogenase
MGCDYDIITIGAGPAGMMAAKTTAQQGLKVLLVNFKKELTKVRRSCCANLINEPNWLRR